MMKLIVCLCGVFILESRSLADEATRRFVGDLLERHEASDGNFWKIADNPAVPGGVIVRFSFDVTGDGKDEWFFHSTALDERWSVYSPEEGGYRLVSRDMATGSGLNTTRIRRENGEVVLSAVLDLYPDLIHIFENRFKSDGSFEGKFHKIEGYAAAMEERSKSDWKEKWGGIVKFENAQRITLRQLLEVEDPEWQPYDFSESILKQETLYTPVESNRKPPFTIVEARKAYRRLREKSSGAVERRNQPSQSPIPKAANQSVEAAGKADEKVPVMGKAALIAALLLLGIAMFRVFGRREKGG